MKLGVIGEPCIDFIYRDGEEPAKHFGGILYSVVTLAVIANRKDEIYPIMNLGEDEFQNITLFLAKFENIKHDFIYRSQHSTRVVKLYYNRGSDHAICMGGGSPKTYDREESSTEPALPVGIGQIMPAAETMNGVLVNMVSGKDIELETLWELRKSYGGYIHMDVHNIVMRTEKDGTRFRGPVKEWLEWCTNCNTLQMNEAEISSISEGKLSEYKIAEKILEDGKVKSVVITRGNRGVTMFEKKIKSIAGKSYTELDKTDIPPVETSRFSDSTGCGDVFASAFFYKSLENGFADLHASLHFANRLASRKSELKGVEELEKLL